MYKSIQTSHSPLSPLPRFLGTDLSLLSSTKYLTPSNGLKTKVRRRTFTPITGNRMVSPPSISPILKKPLSDWNESPSEMFLSSQQKSASVVESTVTPPNIKKSQRDLSMPASEPAKLGYHSNKK